MSESDGEEDYVKSKLRSVVRACSPNIDEVPAAKKAKKMDSIHTKTGGAYIPPARLRMMQEAETDKNSENYQRISWEALKKSINGLVNKVNVSNITEIAVELIKENLVRGRGLLARSLLTAQNQSPTFTNVYAALVAIINSRFPQNGNLIMTRLAHRFKQSYRRNQKEECLHACQFIAHLFNQEVAHELLVLQILMILLETPTEDSVEISIGLLKECGQRLTEVAPSLLAAVFVKLKDILHEQQMEKRVQYMIEVMFAIRKDGFKEHPSVIPELEKVFHDIDQITHEVELESLGFAQLEEGLNVFKVDQKFQENEESYKKIRQGILEEEDSSSDSDGSGSSSEESSSEDEENKEDKTLEIQDMTETNLVALRRTVYLTIRSSLSFEECAHKILKMQFNDKDYPEIFAMIVDCCSQERTYEKFYGLLAGCFCQQKKEHMEQFEMLFRKQYETIHRLETNKLRNVAKFFAHLLHSDSIPWSVFANVVLTEETTTSSGRIFLKTLLLEIAEYLGIEKMMKRFSDPTMSAFYEGVFPRTDPKATRFAINYLTTIGLGRLTEGLREHLTQSAKQLQLKLQQEQLKALAAQSSSSSSSSSSDDSSSDDSSSDERRKKKKSSKKSKKKRKTKKKRSKKNKRKSPTPSSSSSEEEKQDSPKRSNLSEERERRMKDRKERHDQQREDERRQRRQGSAEVDNSSRQPRGRPSERHSEERRKQDDDQEMSRKKRPSPPADRRQRRPDRSEMSSPDERSRNRHPEDTRKDGGQRRSRDRNIGRDDRRRREEKENFREDHDDRRQQQRYQRRDEEGDRGHAQRADKQYRGEPASRDDRRAPRQRHDSDSS